MKAAMKLLGSLFVLMIVVVTGGYVWATAENNNLRSRVFDTHTSTFPLPFPLGPDEIANEEMDADQAAALAMERAVERGRHLVGARYGCTECHGADFSGGVMVDAFPIGTILGPNLTMGEGSKTRDYTPTDWDRIVRHGVRPDGTPGAMPSEDYQRMSDQELSDVITFIRSFEPVDNVVAPVTLGPLGKVLTAIGQFPLSADMIASHDADHAVSPPPAEVSEEFGRHLAGVCTGCHRGDFSGGPIPGGDPAWAPARNITTHADGLADWSYEDFVGAMREGRRPDGSPVLLPMTIALSFTQRMTEIEMQALWLYLRSVPAVASP